MEIKLVHYYLLLKQKTNQKKTNTQHEAGDQGQCKMYPLDNYKITANDSSFLLEIQLF